MTHDHTRTYSGADREWVEVPLLEKGEAWIKVIHADPELHKVVFRFRFGPGTALPPHTHACHAIAYTISGEWEYEGLRLPEEAIAYEPVASTHAATSEHGAELVVVLDSKDDQFLINHLPDGTDVPFDMAFFQTVEGLTAEDAARITAELAAANGPGDK